MNYEAAVRDTWLIMRFWHFPKPTIAAVKGYAIAGACELAIACDITVAAEGSRFGEAELRFGSGIVALIMPWLTGPKKSKEWILTGNDTIDCARSARLGSHQSCRSGRAGDGEGAADRAPDRRQ